MRSSLGRRRTIRASDVRADKGLMRASACAWRLLRVKGVGVAISSYEALLVVFGRERERERERERV